jgi:hypothetical protein
MCISCGVPNERLPQLSNQDYSWDVATTPVPKPVNSEETAKRQNSPDEDPVSSYWMYVCKTGGDEDEG